MSSFSSGYQDVFERPLLCREARTDLDKSSKHGASLDRVGERDRLQAHHALVLLC